jgi:hypothetical protein
MPILSSRVSTKARQAIDVLSRRWKISNAETLRRLVVIGLGGTTQEADALNTEMRKRKVAAEAFFKRKREHGYREHAGRERTPVVAVRLPSQWSSRVKRALGGLGGVIRSGLTKLEE